MTAEAPSPTRRDGLAPARAAVRARLGLVGLLLALAAGGWWWTARQMDGMDDGPWTALGSFSWFLAVWVVMMAAMMLPSVAPTVALYARMTRRRAPYAPLAFTAGYLLVWSAVGAAAYAVALVATRLLGDALQWDRAGRPLAAAMLLVAAAHELTPRKGVCLGKCRSPLGLLLSTWRDGWRGGGRMGVRNGAWCVGCCWALMAALFALGVMSLVWTAVVAAVIALEKTLPWRRTATGLTTTVLLVLGVLLLAAPDALPGLTEPGMTTTPMMTSMH
jgi:predicted metal-binding membrane protein